MSLNSGYHANYNSSPQVMHDEPGLMREMDLQRGVYEIKNHIWGSAVDLNASDKKSVIAFSHHGEGNQQWEFSPLGKGWSIRSVSSGYYLTVEKGLGSGVPLVASEYPVAWNVQPDTASGPDLFRISWPNTEVTWEMQDGRGGTPIQLANRYPTEPQDRKLWRLILIGGPITSSKHHKRISHSPDSYMPEPDMLPRERRTVAHRDHRREREHEQSRARSKIRARDDWSSDSDSDASYTIVKTVTNTKTKSKSSKKNQLIRKGHK